MTNRERLVCWLPAIFLVGIVVILLIWQWRVGALFFNDMGRDLLLAKDLLYNHKLTLYGGRTSLAGVYHGPLWIYLLAILLPFTNGSPLWMSEIWVIAGAVLAWLVGRWVCEQTNQPWTGWVATGLLLLQIPFYSRGVTNPYGVLWTVPLGLWCWWQWQQTKKWYWGLGAFLIGAATVQFELAIGVPLLILMAVATIWTSVRARRPTYLLIVTGAVPLLLTYAAFEIKNHFLQTHAVVAALGSGRMGGTNFSSIWLRLVERMGESWWRQALWPTDNPVWMALAGLIFIWSLYIVWRRGTRRQRSLAAWFVYFFFGYWVLSLVFPGQVQYYYFWGFSAVSAVMVSLALPLWPRSWWQWLMTIVVVGVPLWLMVPRLISGWYGPSLPPRLGEWRFYQQVTDRIYANASGLVSYYAYSPDQFAYAWKYAMWWQDQRHITKIVPYRKAATTFLIMEPSDNPYTNPTAWKTNQVRITTPPIQQWASEDGIQIDQYQLNATEQTIPSDPNLITGTELH